MPSDDLNLNSLSRYSKKSSRYVLEAQSHCEVPAGCGGVVLRWRDPKKGIPLTFRIYAGGAYKFLLDARPLSSTRPIVPFGEHVISIVISEFDPSRVVLLLAAKYEEKGAGIGYSERDTAGALHFASASDGSWKYSSVEPQGNSWQLAGFDDSAWTAMPAREWAADPDQKADVQSYRAEELLRMGAQGLGVAGSPTKVWIRRAFSVRPPA
jgi:hypothetical protein